MKASVGGMISNLKSSPRSATGSPTAADGGAEARGGGGGGAVPPAVDDRQGQPVKVQVRVGGALGRLAGSAAVAAGTPVGNLVLTLLLASPPRPSPHQHLGVPPRCQPFHAAVPSMYHNILPRTISTGVPQKLQGVHRPAAGAAAGGPPGRGVDPEVQPQWKVPGLRCVVCGWFARACVGVCFGGVCGRVECCSRNGRQLASDAGCSLMVVCVW